MILFMAFIVVLVTSMIKQNIDVVETNYYERGIKYQQEIDSREGAENLMSVSNDEHSLYLKTLNLQSVKGAVYFYRPSDMKKDFEVPFEMQSGELIAIPIDAIDKGLWNLKIKWNDSKGTHLIEKELML